MTTLNGHDAPDECPWDRDDDRHAWIAARIARLHLAPGEAPPAWFEPCPACHGVGCHHCDDAGRMHPQRVAWLNMARFEAQSADLVFRHLRQSRYADTAVAVDAELAQGKLAMAFLADWEADGEEPTDLKAMLVADAERALALLAGNGLQLDRGRAAIGRGMPREDGDGAAGPA